MKILSLLALVFSLAAGAAQGQDAATQQQMDKLGGQIKDLTDTVELQRKQIGALEKEVSELREKVATPAVSDSASRDDLKKLAEQVQEIDRNRQHDKELILDNLKKLTKVAVSDPAPVHPHANATPKPPSDPGPAVPQNGYEYVVKAGDTISGIVKKCRDQGVKVTTAQILKANPGLDPTKLYVDKKIFIPDPNAK